MSDYGVPDDLDGVLPWAWAEERLDACRNYWVSTVTSQGRPHLMPVWGIWLPEREQFMFSCAEEAKKARNLRGNPKVSVAVDDSVEVVVLEGVATETRTTEIVDLVRRWAAKYGTDAADGDEGGASEEQLAESLADTTAFLIDPERAFGIIERPDEFGPRATRWVW